MSQSYEPHQLVIQYLSILESAPVVVEEVEKRVFSAVNTKIKQWVEKQINWGGVFGYLDDGVNFQPNSWGKNEDGNFNAWYAIGTESNEGFSYSLSPLLGAVACPFGIWINVDARWITKLSGKGSKPTSVWTGYLAEQFPKTKLMNYGVQLKRESLFLPIRVDPQVLADGYPDSINDSLEPVDAALKILEAVHPEIDALLMNALEYAFGKSSESS